VPGPVSSGILKVSRLLAKRLPLQIKTEQ